MSHLLGVRDRHSQEFTYEAASSTGSLSTFCLTAFAAELCEAAFSDSVGPVLDGVHHQLVDTIGGVPIRVRRCWSEGEMLSAGSWRTTCTPGVSVSQVGRRFDVNANLLFKWRRDPCYRPAWDGKDAPSFLPVEVIPEPLSPPSLAQTLISLQLACPQEFLCHASRRNPLTLSWSYCSGRSYGLISDG